MVNALGVNALAVNELVVYSRWEYNGKEMWVYKYIMYCMNKTTQEVNKVCSQDYRVVV